MGAGQRIKRTAARIPLLHSLALRLRPRGQVFESAYATGAWGSAETGSGVGSEVAETPNVRLYLSDILQRLKIRTFLDAPCGDWNWMRLVDLGGVDYVGADIVAEVIESNRARFARVGIRFIVADLTRDALPCADLILCKDCFVHLSFQDIAAVLENFRQSGATWLLVNSCSHPVDNVNKFTGRDWRHLNLQRAPFHFPPPVESRPDDDSRPFETIALWPVADLPRLRSAQ
jgi:SAM-dependent methyltransferase